MPKTIFLRYRSYHKPVEQGFSKVSSVELVAVLIEVALQIFRFDVVENI